LTSGIKMYQVGQVTLNGNWSQTKCHSICAGFRPKQMNSSGLVVLNVVLLPG